MRGVHKATDYRYAICAIIHIRALLLILLYICIDDIYDRPYLINNQTQFVAWAYGPRATEEGLRDLAFFHTEYSRKEGIPT